ncbi:Transcriptional regulator, AraC family [Labilithrix luteola]|uniref:Transcriptional regulator, AraC family n=1 Tax=Labilithrix luteola TaxID=1391654 RepID=A0A0K1Q2X7_9BACT|nr:AraC family transcriptional regulator [Labilithrix luteola]AKV00124.1 Transcriptional regulator, AraC family [Labilithrix luteola]
MLHAYPLIHTTSVDEAEELESRLNAPVRASPITRRETFEWQANRIAVGSLGIMATAYRGGVRASAPDIGPLYSLMVPVRGGAIITANGTPTALSPNRRGMMLSPSSTLEVELGAGYGGIQVGISAATVASALHVLTGLQPRGQAIFSAGVDLAKATKPSYLRTLELIIEEADRHPRVLASPIVADRMAEAFVYSLLLEGEHDHRSLLERPVRSAEPLQVRRVEEYIRAHLAEPITLEILVTVAGVSARALQAGFRAHREATPMGFLRNCRLDLARTRLLSLHGHETIAKIATECGFQHLGRFNVAYRARFGESPRDTLVRSRPIL